MIIKVGDWKGLSFLEKQDLLIHYVHHNEVGQKLLEREKAQKNKSKRHLA